MTFEPDYEDRYWRLVRAARETRERLADLSECKLTDFQRNTIMTAVEPINDVLDVPDENPEWDGADA